MNGREVLGRGGVSAVARAKIALHDYDLGRGAVPIADRWAAIEISAADLRRILSLLSMSERHLDALNNGVVALQTLLTETKINCDGSEEQVAFAAGVIEAYEAFSQAAIGGGE